MAEKSGPIQRNIAVIGSGCSLHALCWKLSQSANVKYVYAIYGNFGTAGLPQETVKNVLESEVDINEVQKSLIPYLIKENIYIVVVNSKALLAAGVVDEIKSAKILCFGPNEDRLKFENNREWMEAHLESLQIELVKGDHFKDIKKVKDYFSQQTKKNSTKKFVVKATNNFSEEKIRVRIAKDETDAKCAAYATLGWIEKLWPNSKNESIIIEEFLEGEQVNVLAFIGGKVAKLMLPVQDNKELPEKIDINMMTNRGMGAFCPFRLSAEKMNVIQNRIFDSIAKRYPFEGVISAGLMILNSGDVKVIRINCRFGDPETQVLMPLLEGDLFTIIEACCKQKLNTCTELKWKTDASAVGLNLATDQYWSLNPRAIDICEITINRNLNPDGTLKIFYDDDVTSLATDEKKIRINRGQVCFAVAVDKLLIQANKRVMDFFETIIVPRDTTKIKGKDILQYGILREILIPGPWFTTFDHFHISNEPGQENSAINVPNKIISLSKGFSEVCIESGNKVFVTSIGSVAVKLEFAQQYGEHDTIDQDAMAICINKILARGVEPSFFHVYHTNGELDDEKTTKVLSSLKERRELTEVSGSDGLMAVIPQLYETSNQYNFLCSAGGVVEKNPKLPLKSSRIQSKDKIFYLPSNGIHLNGLNIIHKIMHNHCLQKDSKAPFSTENKTYKDEFLKPSKSYKKEVMPLLRDKQIKAFVPITDEGLRKSISRLSLPAKLKLNLNANQWKITPVFGWIAVFGCISAEKMLDTFNCGIGAILIVGESHAKKVEKKLKCIGEVVDRKDPQSQFEIENFHEALIRKMKPFFTNEFMTKYPPLDYKRVAVLLSGTDRNLKLLKALIEDTTNDPRTLRGRILQVISIGQTAEVEKIAKDNKINIEYISEDEEPVVKIEELLQHHVIDIVCVGYGFSKISRKVFQQQKRSCIFISIHPSLLPAFKDLEQPEDIYKEIIEKNHKFSGCSVYFTPESEEQNAVIIDQAMVEIEPKKDNVSSLAEKIEAQGCNIFPRALRMVVNKEI